VVTPFHAMNLSGIVSGDTVAIIGVGGVGLHAISMARLFGANKIIAIDIANYKLELSKILGADSVINAHEEPVIERVKEITGGNGVDVVFEFVGTGPTIQQGLKMLSPGGKLDLGGLYRGLLELNMTNCLYHELQIRTSMDHTKQDLERTIDLVANGQIDLTHSITHRFALKNGLNGINILEKKIENPVRVMLLP